MSFTRGRLVTGYSQTPNGLWTHPDLTNNAKILIGWLWSHTDEYLATVTVNRCRRQFGSSRVSEWLDQLEAAGLVRIKRGANGVGFQFHLDEVAWQALTDRQTTQPVDNPVDSEVAPVPDGIGDRAQMGSVTDPKRARIEDHREDQGEDHPPTPLGLKQVADRLIREGGRVYTEQAIRDGYDIRYPDAFSRAWQARQGTDERDTSPRIFELLVDRIARCAAAGQTIDWDAHARALLSTDHEHLRTLARVNPDPAHQHPHDCPRCDGTGHVDTGHGYTPCT